MIDFRELAKGENGFFDQEDNPSGLSFRKLRSNLDYDPRNFYNHKYTYDNHILASGMEFKIPPENGRLNLNISFSEHNKNRYIHEVGLVASVMKNNSLFINGKKQDKGRIFLFRETPVNVSLESRPLKHAIFTKLFFLPAIFYPEYKSYTTNSTWSAMETNRINDHEYSFAASANDIKPDWTDVTGIVSSDSHNLSEIIEVF